MLEPVQDRASAPRGSTSGRPHVSVCVCTYRRPRLLPRLLEELAHQDTGNVFTHSIVVADNDHRQSARDVVQDFAAAAAIPVTYCVEPQQNIARARNTAVAHATGDFVAFIDDDEVPPQRWLLTLFQACRDFDVDGVLGPVTPRFAEKPPAWVVRGRFCERPTYPTGFVIDWRKGRTGNVLLRRRPVVAEAQPFRPAFLTGEDQDFFRRLIDKGHVFIWCQEAVVDEIISPARWKRTFMLRRALLRGTISLRHPTCGAPEIARSIIGVPLYAALLPLALVSGHHRFMACLVRLVDHLGRLLALAGFTPIKEPYVTE